MKPLPKVWHEVRDQFTGDLLGWMREHTGYEVTPFGERFVPSLDKRQIGEPCPTLTHAMVVCRDHMYANANGAA